MLTVDHYERIRYLCIVQGLSQRQVARELGHSRKTVAKALAYSTPPEYGPRCVSAQPVIAAYVPIVDAWLEDDKSRPRKQRHTAMRIYQRLRDEYGFSGSYGTIARYVRIAKGKISPKEVYVPLEFGPGEEAQVDWGEARIILNGQERVVQLFCMRLCYSRASFVRAYLSQDQVSFLDGHVNAFAHFGGVPRRLAYDNLKTAVVRVGKGRDRTLNADFKALRSHYLFRTRFCNIACGNEKGYVENLVKYAQRTFLTPVPEVANLDELNRMLISGCERELNRLLPHSRESKRECFERENPLFLELPPVPFEACRQYSTIADKQSLVNVGGTLYSVPVDYAYGTVVAKMYVDQVKLYHEGELIGTHRRSQDGNPVLEPFHYLPLLERKPGLLNNGKPFKGEPWGASLTRMRQELEWRSPECGTKKFINILMLQREHPPAAVRAVVERCLRLGAFSDDAVRNMLQNEPCSPSPTLRFSAESPFKTTCSGIRPAASYDVLIKKVQTAS